VEGKGKKKIEKFFILFLGVFVENKNRIFIPSKIKRRGYL